VKGQAKWIGNMSNPYAGRPAASPRHVPTSPVAKKSSSSSIRREGADSGGGVGVTGWESETKLAKKRSVIKSEPKAEASADALRTNTKPERDPRDDLIRELKADLDKLWKSCTCVICQELLFEPYFFQCGHCFCYGVSSANQSAMVTC
jgi:hypothetical protein